MSIRYQMTLFLSNLAIKTLEDGKQAILPFRNVSIPGYSSSQSRQLWYSLLLYKFKDEQDVPELLWTMSREFILKSLREEDTKDMSELYFEQFEEWKEKDYQSFILEVTHFYFQLIEIKDAIEQTKNEETLVIWRPLYGLITKVRNAAKKLNFLNVLDNHVAELILQRERIVYSILQKAYWDIFEEELKKDTVMLISTLHELNQLLKEVHHSITIHEFYPIEKVVLLTKEQDPFQHFLPLGIYLLDVLKAWDSSEQEMFYENAKNEMERLKGEWTHTLRCIMETIFILGTQLKTKKGLWLTLFRQMQNE